MFTYILYYKELVSVAGEGQSHTEWKDSKCVVVAPDREKARYYWLKRLGSVYGVQFICILCVNTETEGSVYF